MSESQDEPQGPAQPTEEELRAALEEQMRKIKAGDVLLQTAVTLVNIAARRLGVAGDPDAEPRDLGEAKLAIDGSRALLPLLPEEQGAPVKDALSQLQIAFAQASGGETGAPTAEGAPPAPAPSPDPSPEKESRIWTPPGSSG